MALVSIADQRQRCGALAITMRQNMPLCTTFPQYIQNSYNNIPESYLYTATAGSLVARATTSCKS